MLHLVSWFSQAQSLQGSRLKVKAPKSVTTNFRLFMLTKIRRLCVETLVSVLSRPKSRLEPDMHISPGIIGSVLGLVGLVSVYCDW